MIQYDTCVAYIMERAFVAWFEASETACGIDTV
jgi:hypothetical protein